MQVIASFERGHARQSFPFQPLQKCSAGGGYIGELFDHSGLAQCGHCVSATRDAAQFSTFRCRRHRFRKGDGGGVEWGRFEGAQGTVSDEGL